MTRLIRLCLGFLFVLFNAALCVTTQAGEMPPELIDRDTLYRLLTEELAEAIRSNDRFTPLPPTVTAVYASPHQKPCFSFGRKAYKKQLSTDNVSSLFNVEHAGFRLIPDGWIAGANERGETIVVAGDPARGIICGLGISRPVHMPPGFSPIDAFFCNGGWIYRTSIGIISEGESLPWRGSENMPHDALIVTSDDTLSIAFVESNKTGGGRWTNKLTVATGIGDDWTRIVCENAPIGKVTGLIRCDRGNMLAIGKKIVRLNGDFKPAPTELDLSSALSAAKAGDAESLYDDLTRLTVYPPQLLSGLGNALSRLPDKADHVRQLEQLAQSTLKQIAEYQRMAAPEDQAETARRLNPAIESYKAQTQQFLESCRATITESCGPSFRVIGDLIRQGYQYYDGKWISHMFVLDQSDLTGVILGLRFFDMNRNHDDYGLFQLDQQEHLHAINNSPRIAFSQSPDAIKDGMGRLWILSKAHGLLCLDGSSITWADRSSRIKQMDGLIACDEEGRLYLKQKRQHDGYSETRYWIYRPNGVERAYATPAAYPNVGVAEIDTLGRLWFVTDGRPRPRYGKQGVDSQLGLPGSEQIELSSEEDLEDSSHASSYSSGTLYRLDPDGSLFRYYQDEHMGQSSILAVNSGAVVLCTSGRQATLIHEKTVYRSASMSGLVQEHFDLMTKLTPERVSLPLASGDYRLSSRPSLVRVEDVIWVASGSKVDAHRDGQSLHIRDRLNLLGIRCERPVLLGPFLVEDKPTLVIACERDRLDKHVWAIQGENGIDIQHTDHLVPKLGEERTKRVLNVRGTPFVDYDTNHFYYYLYNDRIVKVTASGVFEIIGDAGIPICLGLQGQLLVRRPEQNYPGYRLVCPNGLEDMALTYTAPIDPKAILPNGTLLCTTPGGIAWLAADDSGQYTVEEEIVAELPSLPDRIVGQVGETVYLLTTDSHLVVLNR